FAALVSKCFAPQSRSIHIAEWCFSGRYLMNPRNQSGFTLIELLVVIAIISVLCYLGVTSFWVYRSDAAYSTAQQVMYNSRISMAAGENGDVTPPPVSFVQKAQGPIQDAAGKQF